MLAKKRLGIYLTPKKANLVEVKGKKIIKNCSFIFEEEPEDEVIKKVGSFNKALRENGIKTRDAFIGLSNEDLIVRSFIVPAVPPKEIPAVIDFEARRYIPFSIHQLIYDFQYRVDKLTNKIKVIFVGIKKEVFKKYDSVFKQVGFKVLSLEPGVFSILRLLKQRGEIKDDGPFGLIDLDTEESNFTIIYKDFPFFTLPVKIPLKEEDISFKFLSEVKISLDYFRRQFAEKDKSIVKIFLLSEEQFTPQIERLKENFGIPVEVLVSKELTGKDRKLSIGELKAFSLGLRSLDAKTIPINLYKPEALIEKPAEVIPQKIILRTVVRKAVVGLLIILSFMGFLSLWGRQKSLPLERELLEREELISSLKIAVAYNTLFDLQNIHRDYQKKLENFNEEIARLRVKVTPLFDSIPRIIPEGIWLEDMSLTQEGLRLNGLCYLGDRKEESDAIYRFLSSLRENDAFTQRFKEIRLVSMGREEKGRFTITNFEISAHLR